MMAFSWDVPTVSSLPYVRAKTISTFKLSLVSSASLFVSFSYPSKFSPVVKLSVSEAFEEWGGSGIFCCVSI